MLDQEDEGTRFGVWVALGVVFFVLVGVIGGVTLRHLHQSKAAKAAPAVAAAAPQAAASEAAAPAAAAAEALVDAPLSGELLGKLFFAVGQAALPADAAAQIEAAAKALAAAPAKKIVLSGFHDASGDPVKNAELAKLRAFAVRDALKAAGADAARVLLRKPESTTADGSAEEARRVELRLVD
jgi:outer membrane protein OmpA-like peptidoglycan-associated protein